jgi:hypothetical protein
MVVPKFWRSWSWLVASFGVVLPELLQVVADNSDLIPLIDTETKSAIRLVALLLVVLLRPIAQRSMASADPR